MKNVPFCSFSLLFCMTAGLQLTSFLPVFAHPVSALTGSVFPARLLCAGIAADCFCIRGCFVLCTVQTQTDIKAPHRPVAPPRSLARRFLPPLAKRGCACLWWVWSPASDRAAVLRAAAALACPGGALHGGGSGGDDRASSVLRRVVLNFVSGDDPGPATKYIYTAEALRWPLSSQQGQQQGGGDASQAALSAPSSGGVAERVRSVQLSSLADWRPAHDDDAAPALSLNPGGGGATDALCPFCARAVSAAVSARDPMVLVADDDTAYPRDHAAALVAALAEVTTGGGGGDVRKATPEMAAVVRVAAPTAHTLLPFAGGSTRLVAPKARARAAWYKSPTRDALWWRVLTCRYQPTHAPRARAGGGCARTASGGYPAARTRATWCTGGTSRSRTRRAPPRHHLATTARWPRDIALLCSESLMRYHHANKSKTQSNLAGRGGHSQLWVPPARIRPHSCGEPVGFPSRGIRGWVRGRVRGYRSGRTRPGGGGGGAALRRHMAQREARDLSKPRLICLLLCIVRSVSSSDAPSLSLSSDQPSPLPTPYLSTRPPTLPHPLAGWRRRVYPGSWRRSPTRRRGWTGATRRWTARWG